MPAKQIKNVYVNPQNKLNYSRSLFNWEDCHSFNMLTGYIYPVATLNCMPGDTVPNKFGFVLQSAPLISPTLDNVYIDIISVWVPTRLVMADFNEWLGDSDTYAWTLTNNVSFPKVDKLDTGIQSSWNGQSGTFTVLKLIMLNIILHLILDVVCGILLLQSLLLLVMVMVQDYTMVFLLFLQELIS